MISSKRQINIACLQTRPRPDFKSALDEAIALAEEAIEAGAEILTLPEYCGGLKTEGTAFAPPFEAEESHPVLKGLRDFAKNRKKYLLIGSIAIKGPAEKILNRSFIIDECGNIISRYDKIHLFDITLSEKESYRESATVHGGQTAIICQTPLGCFGQTICYDLRLTSIGHPVIGDPQYGKSPLKQLSGISTELSQTLTNFKRQALHAEILGFEHPVSGEWLEFKAPFPDDYKILLKTIQHD